jgi:hypothetical protein
MLRPDLIELVEGCTAVATAISGGACDGCLEIAIRGLKKVIMVVEMQQRQVKRGEVDTIENRLVNHARKMAIEHPDAFIDALAYLGWDRDDANRLVQWIVHRAPSPGAPDLRTPGPRGRLGGIKPRNPNFIDLATASSGRKKDWTDYEKEIEDLTVEERLERIRSKGRGKTPLRGKNPSTLPSKSCLSFACE